MYKINYCIPHVFTLRVYRSCAPSGATGPVDVRVGVFRTIELNNKVHTRKVCREGEVAACGAKERAIPTSTEHKQCPVERAHRVRARPRRWRAVRRALCARTPRTRAGGAADSCCRAARAATRPAAGGAGTRTRSAPLRVQYTQQSTVQMLQVHGTVCKYSYVQTFVASGSPLR